MSIIMKTNLEEISPVKKKLTIEIGAEEINKKLNQAYIDLGKGVKIPGFRTGKVPVPSSCRQCGRQPHVRNWGWDCRSC